MIDDAPVPSYLCLFQDITNPLSLGSLHLPKLRFLRHIDSSPLTGLLPLRLFHSSVNIRGDPTYFELGGREGDPDCP